MKIYLLIFLVVLTCQYIQVESQLFLPWSLPETIQKEESRILPGPIATFIDIILFPIRPLIDAFCAFVQPIVILFRLVFFPIRVLFWPLVMVIKTLTIPARIVRYFVYLPLNLIIGPLRLVNAIANFTLRVLRSLRDVFIYIVFFPAFMITIPIRLFFQPTTTIYSLLDIQEAFITLPIYVIYQMILLPFRSVMSFINCATFPIYAILWIVRLPLIILFLPLRMLLFPIRAIRYLVNNFLLFIPMVLPTGVAIMVRITTFPILLLCRAVENIGFLSTIIGQPMYNVL